MKYYFLTTGEEQGAELPTEMTEKYGDVIKEYNNIDEDDYFYIGIYEFDTSTLKVNELLRKGYINY